MKSIKFGLIILLTAVTAVVCGRFVGKSRVVELFDWQSPDGDIKSFFTADPIENYSTYLEDYASATMFTVICKHSRGLDELDRFEATADNADARLYNDTVKSPSIKVLRDDPEDFLLEILDDKSTPEVEQGIIRGRIFFHPDGKYLYRVWIVRNSEDETEMPSAKKILFAAIPVKKEN